MSEPAKLRIQECEGKYRVQQYLQHPYTSLIGGHYEGMLWWKKWVERERDMAWRNIIYWHLSPDETEWTQKLYHYRNDWKDEQMLFDSREEALEMIHYYFGTQFLLEPPEWRTV